MAEESDYDSSNPSESSDDDDAEERTALKPPVPTAFPGNTGGVPTSVHTAPPAPSSANLFDTDSKSAPSNSAAAALFSSRPEAQAPGGSKDCESGVIPDFKRNLNISDSVNRPSQFENRSGVLTTVVLPEYPFRMLVLLHKWTAYEPVVLLAGPQGVLLVDWSKPELTQIQSWEFGSIVSVTPDARKSRDFSIEIARSGFSLRNAVWTFTSSHRAFIMEQILSFWELVTLPSNKSHNLFEGRMIDTARRKCNVDVVLRLGGMHIIASSGSGKVNGGTLFQIRIEDLHSLVKLTDIPGGILVIAKSGVVGNRDIRHRAIVLEVSQQQRDAIVDLLRRHAVRLGCARHDKETAGEKEVEGLRILDGELRRSLSLCSGAQPTNGSADSNVEHKSNIFEQQSMWDWDWYGASPCAPQAMPLSTFSAVAYVDQRKPTLGSKLGQDRTRRCELVWTRGILLDMDPDSKEVLRWWRPENIRALWCSDTEPTRIVISDNTYQYACEAVSCGPFTNSSETNKTDAYDTHPSITPSFAVYDCLQRDALLAAVTGSETGEEVPILVGKNDEIYECIEAFFKSHIILPKTGSFSQAVKTLRQVNESAFSSTAVEVNNDLESSSQSLHKQERMAAVNLVIKQLGSAIPPGTSSSMMGVLGENGNNNESRIISAARGLCANVMVTYGCDLLSSSIDEEVIKSAVSALAHQIVLTRLNTETPRAHLLLTALTRLLRSPVAFTVFFDLQSAVVMVNRIFQELALYIKDSASRSLASTSSGRSLVIHQMLLLFVALVSYGDNDIRNAERAASRGCEEKAYPDRDHEDIGLRDSIRQAERQHRHELFSSKRGEILVTLLRQVASGAEKNAGSRSLMVAGEAGCVSELVALASLRLFSVVMCGHSSQSTSLEHLHYLRPLLTDHRIFLGLFAFKTCPPLSSLVATLLREIVSSAQPAFVDSMRQSVLVDGTALVHVHSALFGSDEDTRMQSRFMLSLFMDNHASALSLLRRCLPSALVDVVDTSSFIGSARSGQSAESRWQSLFVALERDHNSAALVWDEKCRKTLKHALIHELMQLDQKRRALRQHRGKSGDNGGHQLEVGDTDRNQSNKVDSPNKGNSIKEDFSTYDFSEQVAWNFRDFSVSYKYAMAGGKGEGIDGTTAVVVVDGIFLEPLTRNCGDTWRPRDLGGAGKEFPVQWEARPAFFEHLYRRCLMERGGAETGDVDKARAHRLCLRALEVTYPWMMMPPPEYQCETSKDTEQSSLQMPPIPVEEKYAHIDTAVIALVAAEAASTLTWSSSLETRSAALDLALQLTKDGDHGRERINALNALSFAKHGGIDACAHMLVLTASINGNATVDDASIQRWKYRHTSGSPIMGPVGVQQLCHMLSHGEINELTLTKAVADEKDDDWTPLRKRTALLLTVLINSNSSETKSENTLISSPMVRLGVSLIAKSLKTLISCCTACPATNINGAVVWPLPLPRSRLLFGDGCLKYLVQTLLLQPPQQGRNEAHSEDPNHVSLSNLGMLPNDRYSENEYTEIIRMSVELLIDILKGDFVDTMPKLYLSGIFYYSLLLISYFGTENGTPVTRSGIRLVELVARLIRLTHLRQRFPLWQPLPARSTVTKTTNIASDDKIGASNIGETGLDHAGLPHSIPSFSSSSSTGRVSGHLLARASVLGTLLPESMICMLEYDAQCYVSYEEKPVARGLPSKSLFSRILLGNASTPEIIWTPSMLKTLQECLLEHLEPFRSALHLDPTLQYEFEPCPPIEYEQLNSELYCHSYFLRNLCDDKSFPDWPISDPEGVLRDIIDAWRSELATASEISKGESMTFSRAAEIMGLIGEFNHQQQYGISSEHSKITTSLLRKAYLRLALKLHPDRNIDSDNSKKAFTELHLAYKRLSLIASGRAHTEGDPSSHTDSSLHVPMSDIVTTHLLLRAQTLLFDRFPSRLGTFKYPMFPTLVKICGSGRITDTAPLLAMRAVAQIASASTSNAKELLAHRGFELVVSALRASVGVARENRIAGAIRSACLIAVAAIMSVEEGRIRLPACAVIKSVLLDTLFKYASRISVNAQDEVLQPESDETYSAALACLHHVSLCSNVEARSSLVERGCLYPLLKVVLLPLVAMNINEERKMPQKAATASRPWGDAGTIDIFRREYSLRILLAFAGFRVSGKAIVCDDEHLYVRNALERIFSKPLLLLLARSYANCNSNRIRKQDCTEDYNVESPSSALNQLNLSLTAAANLVSQLSTTSPLLIWDKGMREAALIFVEKQLFTFDSSDEDPHLLLEKDNTKHTFDGASMFSRALGPVLGFSHERLHNEPVVGDIYLKPFVSHVSSSIATQHATSSGAISAPSTLAEFGINGDQFLADLIQYIEGAARAESLLSNHMDKEQAAIAAAKFQNSISSGGMGRGFGVGGRGGLQIENAESLAKAAAEAAATSSSRLYGVLYALKAIYKLLDGGRGDVSTNFNSLSQSQNDGSSNISNLSYEHQQESVRCIVSCASFLVHHVSPIFACATGRLHRTSFALVDSGTRKYDICATALLVIQKISSIQDLSTEMASSLKNNQTPPGRLFARYSVDAGVLWTLLGPLRAQSPCPMPHLKLLLQTLLCLINASPVASANLAGLGIAVDLVHIFVNAKYCYSETSSNNDDVNLSIRCLATTLLASLASQPSCGGQIRGVLLRMLPSRLVERILFRSESSTVNNDTENHVSLSAVHYFDSDHDEAELIWNQECRQELHSALISIRAELTQRRALSAKNGGSLSGVSSSNVAWSLPSDFVVPYTAFAGVFVVSKVFVRKFLRDTTVTLSDPVQFAIDLVRLLAQSPDGKGYHNSLLSGNRMNTDTRQEQLLVTPHPIITTENISLLVRAFVALLMQNPELASHVARAGLIPSVLHRLVDAVGEEDTQQACLSVITQLIIHSHTAVKQVSTLFKLCIF